MLSTAIVIFREVLEIALILGVVVAATNGLAGRNRFILAGIALGIFGAGLVAVFAQAIATAAEGMGQEFFNATILLTASLVIGWTVLWMAKHGREAAQHLRSVSSAVAKGDEPFYSLVAVIALAILREGAEIVLFTNGMIAAGQTVSSIVYGSILGLTGGAALGYALYRGIVSFSPRYIFRITTWMLAFLCAGMSATAAKFLANAGWFSSMTGQVWDTSAILSESSFVGQTMNVLFGYSSRPYEIQVVFYVATLSLLIAAMTFISSRTQKKAVVAA